jgi:membrane protease YdiL (CAAX protease family)
MSIEDQTPIHLEHSRSPVRLLIAWLVIFALVGLVLFSNIQAARVRNYGQLLVAEQARMVARLAVQMKSLQTGSDAASALFNARMDVLITQIEKTSRTPGDKIRLAVLAGESMGAEAALKQLEEVEKSQNSSEVASDILTLRTIYEDEPSALEPADREKLISRYGYLGRLALAYGVPADQEPRKTLVTEAFWFTARLGLIGMSVAAMSLLSLGLFVLGCVWFFKGRIQSAITPNTSSVQVFLEAFALYLALFVASGRLLLLFGATNVQWTWTTLLILPVVWQWISRRSPSTELRKALGWHRGQGFIREAVAGVGGYLAGMPLIVVGSFITFLLIRVTGVEAGSPIIQELRASPLGLVGLYGLACVFAPVMEETMFRGVLFHHLRQRWRWAISAAIVSLIFALLHPQGWVAVPVLGAIAMVLAGLREWRGSLIAPITAHACNNFLALTFALLLLK